MSQRRLVVNWPAVLIIGGGFVYAGLCGWFGLNGIVWPVLGIVVLYAVVAWRLWR